MDRECFHRVNEEKATGRAPQSWLDAIGRGEADVAAGRVADVEAFLAQLEAEDAAEMTA
jgi:predicted transcriptional regulator